MNLADSASEAFFRRELCAWLGGALPSLPPQPAREDWDGRRAFDLAWQARLFENGYAGVDWPKEWGGRGATPAEQMIFLEEAERAGAPYVGVNFVGLLHAGPTIAACGTEVQKVRYLPPILKGEEVWCQGFSEPGAGSDLASLTTSAVRDGDGYVVNGQKIWTSHAQVADFCELLVRTDPTVPKHKGLTWVILDMRTPGITVRPMKTIGGSSEFSEVFLDDVHVPVANRVGEENGGWKVAMVTFSFERGTAFISDLVRSRNLLAALNDLASRVDPDDRGIRREIGHLVADLDGLWALTKRTVSEASTDGAPGPGGSVFKLAYTEMRQKLGALAMRLLGPGGLAFSQIDDLGNGPLVDAYIYGISMSIAAGTSQIQRNIIAERVLGLPKEPAWSG